MKLIVAFLLLGSAFAKCPNACSGHGDCGANDACTCYSGFQGGDCSERVCMYNWAWVTTATGDLNFDGDRYDGTVYSASSRLNPANLAASPGSGGPLLITQSAPGGGWESWPYTGVAEEGHFYMECSNRGLCDRQKGDCMCFDGYTGTSCNRMICPEDCNGHGTCVTVGHYDQSYALWDKEMARSCKCDPGYAGPACQERKCPHGNDVLTKENELPEVQYVDVFAKCDTGATVTGCPTLGAASKLGGFVRFTFTDKFGEAYTTKPVAVAAKGETTDEYGNAVGDYAAGVAAALMELPNNVTSNNITVESQYCEVAADVGAAFDAATGDTAGNYKAYRVPAATTAAERTKVYRYDTVGTATVGVVPHAATPATGTLFNGDTAVSVNEVLYPHCMRFKITFNKMAGNLNPLTIDTSDVTFAGLTDTQSQYDLVDATVSSQVKVTEGASLTAIYRAPATTVVALAAATVTRATPSKIDFTADVFHATNGAIFYPGQKVKVECEEVNGETPRNLGLYTVTDTTDETVMGSGNAEGMNKQYLYVDEYVLACTGTGKYRVTSVQNAVQFSAVATTALAPFDVTQIQDFANLWQTRIMIAQATTGKTYTFGAVVTKAAYFTGTALAATAYSTSVGYVLIGDEDATGSLVGDATDGTAVTAADLQSALAGATDGTAIVTIYVDQHGTMENSECGDRGICQDDGTCKCFSGYSGADCSIQKSIAM